MAETINIGEIAGKLSKDIFRHFFWETHPKKDDNFECTNSEHKTPGGKPKGSHPGDVVFSYEDPYLGNTIYLHTDLKSYAKDSITPTALRTAFKSLCMTIECAKESEAWREKYSVDPSEHHEVRGLLFVHNHDHGYAGKFEEALDKINLESLPIPANAYVHFLGPKDIQRLYSIGHDIIRLKESEELARDYTFYYPDLVMWRRQGDVWSQPATIEALTSPYLIIKHKATKLSSSGYVIYYNRSGSSTEEFEYFLDSLSRYQMLESGESIRVRVTHDAPHAEIKSIFHKAKKRYVKSWGFDPIRESILDEITIEPITAMTDTYNPGDMGWRV